MLEWKATGQTGHYALYTLDTLRNDTLQLDVASYNDVKIYPAAVYVRNFANDGNISVTLGDGVEITIPARTNTNIVISGQSRIKLFNQGRGACQFMFADSAGISQSDLALTFDGGAAARYDYLLHFPADGTGTTNAGIETGGDIVNSGCGLTPASKFGIRALAVASTTNYLQITNNSFFNWSLDATLDLWAELPGATPTTQRRIISTTTVYVAETANVDGLDFYVNGTTVSTGSIFTRAIGVYHHIAVVKSGRTFRLFFNGAIVATIIDDTVVAADNYLVIGDDPNVASVGAAGNRDELRYSRGVAQWDAPFTPPIAPYY